MSITSGNGFWKGRRVFVTGTTGIVGAWLVKALLARGAYVVVLMRDANPQSELLRSGDIRQVTVVSGCLEDLQTLERVINEDEVDTVFHLAAQPIVGVSLPVTHLRGQYSGQLQSAGSLPHPEPVCWRVVIASSDKAYGAQPNLPCTEEMPLQGRHPYEVSKSCTDLITQSYFHSYGLPVAIARCSNIYGGGHLNRSRIVPAIIRAFLRGERPIIRSDGTYVRDYVYVKDVARAYMRLAERLDDPQVQGQAFNFSPERAVTVLELVAILQRLMRCEHLSPDVRNEARGEIHSQYLCADKAHIILNWQPQYMLEHGLVEAVEWYSRFLTG